jgi:hypothetical protein
MDESDLAGVEIVEAAAAGPYSFCAVLTRALTILELLATSSNGMMLPEVARKLQIPGARLTVFC